MQSVILRVRAPDQGWCRQVSLKHRGLQIRVLSCFPLASGEFLEDVGMEGAGWRAAYHDALRTSNIAEARIVEDEPEHGRVRFRVKACPLVHALAETGAVPQFPFRVAGGHDYWVFVSQHADAPRVVNQLKTMGVQADVVYSGPFDPPEGLTNRQSEILARAVEEGYYEYPKRTSLTHLAEKLGLAKSTLSESLVMIEREVVRHYVKEAAATPTGLEVPARFVPEVPTLRAVEAAR